MKARKRGPPEKISKWMDFMDEHNRRFFYNFEKNIAKYESVDEPPAQGAAAPAAPEVAAQLALAVGSGQYTSNPPVARDV